jgi:hypothetical protein
MKPFVLLLLIAGLLFANNTQILPYPDLESFAVEGQERWMILTVGIGIMTLAIAGRYFSSGNYTYAIFASAMMLGVCLYFLQNYLRPIDKTVLVLIELVLIIFGFVTLAQAKGGEG